MSPGRQKVRWMFYFVLLLLVVLTVMVEQDRAELAELALVVGFGLDQAGEAPQTPWKLTVELAYKEQNDAPGESQVFTVTGKDWAALQAALARSLDKTPYWSNAVLLVVDGSLLEDRQGQELLRAIYLDPQLSGELLFVVAETSADQVFSASFGASAYVSSGLEQGLRLAAEEEKSRPVTLSDYMERVLAMAGTLSLPLVEVSGNGQAREVRIEEQEYIAI